MPKISVMTLDKARDVKMELITKSGKTIVLKPPRQLTLEQALEYIEEDELVEVTPRAIRMRKLFLKENDRKKHARQMQQA